jgi:hypothetical protein
MQRSKDEVIEKWHAVRKCGGGNRERGMEGNALCYNAYYYFIPQKSTRKIALFAAVSNPLIRVFTPGSRRNADGLLEISSRKRLAYGNLHPKA